MQSANITDVFKAFGFEVSYDEDLQSDVYVKHVSFSGITTVSDRFKDTFKVLYPVRDIDIYASENYCTSLHCDTIRISIGDKRFYCRFYQDPSNN